MHGDQKRYSKMELRRLIKSILSQFEEKELVAKSELLSHRLLDVLEELFDNNLLKNLDQGFVGGFAPLNDEPDWFLDLEKRIGNKFAFPGLDSFGQMVFLKAKRKDLIIKKDFGVPLHVPPQENLHVTPKLLVVPGLSFGKKGERLGRGKGFYDRYLEKFSGLKVGVCFNEQVFDGIPMGPGDQYVDYVVTDERTLGPF